MLLWISDGSARHGYLKNYFICFKSKLFSLCKVMFIPSIQILAARLRGAMCDRKISLVWVAVRFQLRLKLEIQFLDIHKRFNFYYNSKTLVICSADFCQTRSPGACLRNFVSSSRLYNIDQIKPAGLTLWITTCSQNRPSPIAKDFRIKKDSSLHRLHRSH